MPLDRTVRIDRPRHEVTTALLACALDGGHPINRFHIDKGVLVLTRIGIWWPYPTGTVEIRWWADTPHTTTLRARWITGRADSRVGASVVRDADRLLADTCGAVDRLLGDDATRRRVDHALAWLGRCGTVRPSALPSHVAYTTGIAAALVMVLGLVVGAGDVVVTASGGTAVAAGTWSLSALAQSEGRDALNAFRRAVGTSTGADNR